jgi:SAM-dependent methyltransferase
MSVDDAVRTEHARAELAAVVGDLRGHPLVHAAHLDDDGTVVVAVAPEAVAVTPEPGPLVREHLDHWGEVYDWTYREGAGGAGGDPQLSGWRASDTGEPFPATHMAEWADRTADLVAGTGARRVLELGCGTGLLVHRLRSRVAGYVGTDVAPAALDRLRGTVGDGVALVPAAAHEVAGPAVAAGLRAVGAPGGRPDCVVVNSVTQCFPNVAYLGAVVAGAVALVAPGGSVVVGDVRHAGLLGEWARWVERRRDPAAASATVARRADARLARDDELAFDPVVLAGVAERTGRDVRLRVHPRTMGDGTELARFRFDAVLHVDPPDDGAGEVGAGATVSWAGLGADPLPALVAAVAAGPLHVVDVSNGWLVDGGPAPAALHDALVGLDAVVVLDPVDPRRLGVVAPASAAPVPVTAVVTGPDGGRRTGLAHEPFAAFARRRVTAAVRAALRPCAGDAPIEVRVDLPVGT